MTADDASRIRQARRARVRTIRGRVIGYSVALFAIVWSLIAVLLVTGHDPVLSRQTAASVPGSGAGSAGSSAATGLGSEDSGSGSGLATGAGSSNTAGASSAGSSTSTGSGGLVSPSPVTSGQS